MRFSKVIGVPNASCRTASLTVSAAVIAGSFPQYLQFHAVVSCATPLVCVVRFYESLSVVIVEPRMLNPPSVSARLALLRSMQSNGWVCQDWTHCSTVRAGEHQTKGGPLQRRDDEIRSSRAACAPACLV